MKYEHGLGLLIGIPTLGRPVPLAWAMAFKSQTPPINYNANVAIIFGKKVADARNELCEEALKQGAKYLFCMGDDTVPPPHALRQLIFRMEQDSKLGIVGGIYCSKSDPPAPLVFRGNGQGSYWDWKIGEYFEVSGLGMDCTLIRTEILKSLSQPWFKTIDTNDFLSGRNYAEMWTEDLFFCKKVLDETDFHIFADSMVMCEHHDVFGKRVYTLPPNSLPMRKFVFSGDKKILDIGCGEIEREFEEGIPVRVDAREECHPDYRCDIRQLPFDDNYFDIIFASHVLEHFSREESELVLKEWLRVLKSGGEVKLILPNIEWAFQHFNDPEMRVHALNVLYGAQSNKLDFHQIGYTPETLTELVERNGCKVFETKLENYNIFLFARKE